MANKIKFGLRNVYYATITESGGTIAYGTPVKIDGAVNLSLSASGDKTPLYADDIQYFNAIANNGYEGDLEIALLPADFKKDILQEKEDANGALIEDADKMPLPFALGFEIQGDDKGRRVWMYNCVATRPNVEGQTKEASITPKTDTLSLTAMPRATDHKVKALMELSASNTTAYNGFFTQVYEETASL